MDTAVSWGMGSHVVVQTEGGVFLSIDDGFRMKKVRGSLEDARSLAAVLIQAADDEEGK